MKPHVILVVTSLLSIFFMMLHLADDIVRGFEPGDLSNYTGVLILVVWLYATLVLAERRSGYVILLIASLLGSFVPVLHMKGAGLGGKIADSSGGLLFVATLLALGVTSLFSFILSARGLWSLRRGQPR
jgi:amino acid transporter